MSTVFYSRLLLPRQTECNTDAKAIFHELGGYHVARFVENLVLYDKVLIPTFWFGEVLELIRVLGMHPFLDILDQGRVKFVFLPYNLAFGGGGQGLVFFNPAINSASDSAFTKSSFAQDPREVLEKLLIIPSNNQIVMRSLIDKMLGATQVAPDSIFSRKLYNQAREDLSKMTLLGGRPTSINFNLLGKDENSFTLYNGGDAPFRPIQPKKKPESAIQALLRFIHGNLELSLAAEAGVEDIESSSVVRHQIDSKARLMTIKLEKGLKATTALRKVAGVPFIGADVVRGHVSFEDVVRLTASRRAREFRKWFLLNRPEEDADEMIAAYIDLLKSEGHQSRGIRTMRFLIGQIAGLQQPLGLGVSAIDQFIFERPAGPRLFLDRLNSLSTRGSYAKPIPTFWTRI